MNRTAYQCADVSVSPQPEEKLGGSLRPQSSHLSVNSKLTDWLTEIRCLKIPPFVSSLAIGIQSTFLILPSGNGAQVCYPIVYCSLYLTSTSGSRKRNDLAALCRPGYRGMEMFKIKLCLLSMWQCLTILYPNFATHWFACIILEMCIVFSPRLSFAECDVIALMKSSFSAS